MSHVAVTRGAGSSTARFCAGIGSERDVGVIATVASRPVRGAMPPSHVVTFLSVESPRGLWYLWDKGVKVASQFPDAVRQIHDIAVRRCNPLYACVDEGEKMCTRAYVDRRKSCALRGSARIRMKEGVA